MEIFGQNRHHQHRMARKIFHLDNFLLFSMFIMLIIMGCGNSEQAPNEGKTSESAIATKEPSDPSGSQAESPPVAMEITFSIDPCALITKTDAEALAASPMNEPLQDHLEDPAGKGCRYFTTKDSNHSRTVEITVWESNNLKQGLYGWPADEHFARFKAGHKNAGKNFEQLKGLGDDAYFWGSHVHALIGPNVLMVSARGFGSGGPNSNAKNKEATIKAATLAIGRLQ